MSTSDKIGITAAALCLLVASAVIQEYSLWSTLGSYTVPWFCTALAIALLIVLSTAILCGSEVSLIPISRILVMCVGSSLAVGIGMFVDGEAYGFQGEWIVSVGEWFGFTAILAVVFWLPRNRDKKNSNKPENATPKKSSD